MPLDDNRMGPSANYAGYWLLSSQATKPNPNPNYPRHGVGKDKYGSMFVYKEDK